MSDSANTFPENNPSGFCSPNCVDFVIDGPGDRTVRPLSGELLRLALEERERLAAWEREQARQDETPKNGA
jgi:hypothetical protein